MQYILTEQEYRTLTPANKVNEVKEKVRLLNEKVLELTGYPCGKGVSGRGFTCYCDDCPIAAFRTRTSEKSQQYSK